MDTLDYPGASGEQRVHRVVSNGISLNVLELAPRHRSRTTAVMQHGLRDSAHALLPIARQLSEHFHVLLPELRGHGRSDRSDAYGVYDFVLDLKEVASALAGQRVALFGQPATIFLTSPFPGAVRMTLLAPFALRCRDNPSRSRQTPVLSTTKQLLIP